MLSLDRDNFLDEERVYIHFPGVETWISRHPRRDLEHGPDWRLWVRRAGDVARTGKSPTRLAIESQLRAWILRHFRRPLCSLCFEEIRSIALREEQGRLSS
jgi:hypothetical protein